MCGIVGLVKRDAGKMLAAQDIFNDLLYVGAVRGAHATGVMAAHTDGTTYTWKRSLASADFLQLKQTQEVLKAHDIWATIGHNRFATTGRQIDAHAHPFDHGNIVLVHNGTLRYAYQLNQQAFDVDSEAICYMLANNELIPSLEKIQGAYALAWFNLKENALYLARNKERPLYYGVADQDEFTIIASERLMLEWIAGRHQVNLTKVEAVPVGKVLRITQDSVVPQEVGTFTPHVELVHTNPSKELEPWPKPNKQKRTYLKNEADAILFAANLKRDLQIKFRITNAFPQQPLHSSGSIPTTLIFGRMVGPDNNLVIKSYVSGEWANSGDICSGRIVGAQPATPNNQYNAVWVSDVKYEGDKRDEDDVAELILGPAEEYMPMLYKRTDKDITQALFYKFTKAGCSLCSNLMVYDDLDRMLWTDNNSPICADCVKDLQEAPKQILAS